jgi:hypothetical protein
MCYSMLIILGAFIFIKLYTVSLLAFKALAQGFECQNVRTHVSCKNIVLPYILLVFSVSSSGY